MATDPAPEYQRAWLTLIRTPGLGAVSVRALLQRHGDVLLALEHSRRNAELSPAARAWLAAPDPAVIAADEAWLAAPDHHLIVLNSPDYPVLLRNVHNAPAALFVAGDPIHLWSPQIAIVGSRSASAAGIANARAFAKAFVNAGNVVTSGLAEGIDGAAHAAALDAGGITIAVLGTGPDLVYPQRHRELAARIIASGALVSEFPPGTPGRPEHFPRRNRIIAGLSLGTLIIEAGLNSGSLITARLAAEQGREVFALPGSIHSPLARGSHRLIREGARLVETAGEVLDDLRGVGGVLAAGLRQRLADADGNAGNGVPLPLRTGVGHDNDPDYVCLLAALDHTPAALDELAERTALPAGSLSSMLLLLELEGMVIAENGRYARVA